MAKRRKRTNSNVPAKGRLKAIADRLWSLAIRADWAWKCAVCGASRCDAHHLVPRHNQATRYDLNNGIALCPRHHQFCPEISPHQNAAGWMAWLEENHPSRAEWYQKNRSAKFTGTLTVDYYCDVIRGLREYVDENDFESVVGVRFSQWLEENE